MSIANRKNLQDRLSQFLSMTQPVNDLLKILNSDSLDDRLAAIQALGEVGDENVLHLLRKRLAVVNKELAALVMAVGKLKKKLKVK